MSLKLSISAICLGAIALALCIPAVCTAQTPARQQGRSIAFSVPRSDEVTTNLHQISTKKDSLKQLEEDLYKPLQSFSPKSSLDGVSAPMPRRPIAPAVQSKRAKDLLERRKNWVFMRPEDLVAEPTVEDILKAPELGTDGREKQQLRPMDQYYQRLATKRPAASRPGQSKEEDLFGSVRKANATDQTGAHDDSSLPEGLRESAQALKSAFGTDKTGDPAVLGATHSSFANPFGLSGNTLSKEQVLEHKKFMNDYHSLVDPTWQPPAVGGAPGQPAGFAALAQPVKSPSAGLPNAFTATPHHGLDAQNDVLNPMLGPQGLPDVNARAVGQSRPSLPLPHVEAPKVVSPTFAAPRRSF